MYIILYNDGQEFTMQETQNFCNEVNNPSSN